MAPQAAPKQTPEQIQAENNEARTGSDNDALLDRGPTIDPNQNPDPLRTGVERREPIQRAPADDFRSQIAARFRRTEPDGERPFNGDFNDNENLYGVVGQDDQPTPDADDTDDDLAGLGLSADEIARARGKAAAPAGDDDEDESLIEPQPRQRPQPDQQQPQKKRLKVNGRVVELTDEEILAAAQKTLAADTYLDEAKALLKEAKAIRTGRTANHSGENDAETTDLGSDPPDMDAQNPEPSTVSVIQKIQFGDPEEAAAELDRLVESKASKKANEGQLQRLISQDLARSKKALADFAKENEALAQNRVAALAIENGMYDAYVEDMLNLGLSEDQIPKNNPQQLADWHRFYRINGYEVRSTKELLNASKDKFLKDIGAFRGPRQQQQPSRQQPRIAVNVDRDQRRMAIPNQPTRSVAPRRDANPQQRPQTGSDVVANMRRARGQPVV